MKKYCLTSLSVSELLEVSNIYSGFNLSHISDFEKNVCAYEKLRDSRIDVVYIFSQLVKNNEEFGGILSGNVFISGEGIYGLDASGGFIRIQEKSIVYLLRTGDMPKSFLAFFVTYARKKWDIQVITNFKNPEGTPLSTKCHTSLFMDSNHFPESIIPYICSASDFSYLAGFIKQSNIFSLSIIVKKAGYSSGDGVKIFEVQDTSFALDLGEFLKESRTNDYIIMELLVTEDIEYRAYWVKKNGIDPEILELHRKEHLSGQVLHNIAKGNILRRLDKNLLSGEIQEDILGYCRNIPELHGGLDILVGKDGRFYFTENNIMTGYLSEPEEQYFAKNWLDAISDCYKYNGI